MAQLHNCTTGFGNTKSKTRIYCITWNNYSEDDLTWLKEYCEEKCDEYTYQPEVGENGTPHIQGALKFKNARTWNAVKKDLHSCHIEPCRNWKKAVEYCRKDDTKAGEAEVKIKEKPRFKFHINDPLKDKTLYEWQQQVIDVINSEREERYIYWFWEPKGNAGKTSLAKHICLNDPNALYLTGKGADMKYAVFSCVEEGMDIRTIIVDIPRSTGENFVSYSGIEQIKGGIFFNNKYESKMCIFNNPHIICFANWEPKIEEMSEDRWKIINISNKKEIEEQEKFYNSIGF